VQKLHQEQKSIWESWAKKRLKENFSTLKQNGGYMVMIAPKTKPIFIE